ncbi:MAG: hypothetical protein IGS39_00970 [Calothrix sp. C42_A2020_038]|nr:hypothetical protein [Calothrix sp. C42_A2020_038]
MSKQSKFSFPKINLTNLPKIVSAPLTLGVAPTSYYLKRMNYCKFTPEYSINPRLDG